MQQAQDIDKRLEPFTDIPNPNSYDGAIKDLADAMGDLSRGKTSDPIDGRVFKVNEKLSHIDSAGDTLEDWDGDAADKFMENFRDKFEYVSTNQFLVLNVMKNALEADQERGNLRAIRLPATRRRVLPTPR